MQCLNPLGVGWGGSMCESVSRPLSRQASSPPLRPQSEISKMGGTDRQPLATACLSPPIVLLQSHEKESLGVNVNVRSSVLIRQRTEFIVYPPSYKMACQGHKEFRVYQIYAEKLKSPFFSTPLCSSSHQPVRRAALSQDPLGLGVG